MKESINERRNKWKNKWIKEGINARTNKWKKE